MTKWRSPLFATLALLAMFASLVPQWAWACPMTGRVGGAAFVCQTQTSRQCCKNSQGTMVCCAKGKTADQKCASQTCARPGGKCCKLVNQSAAKSLAASSTSTASLVLPTLIYNNDNPALATLPPLPFVALPSFITSGASPPDSIPPPQSGLAFPLQDRAPPLS